jgi:hypothetical protein
MGEEFGEDGRAHRRLAGSRVGEALLVEAMKENAVA